MSNHATMASLLDGNLSVNNNCKITKIMLQSQLTCQYNLVWAITVLLVQLLTWYYLNITVAVLQFLLEAQLITPCTKRRERWHS